MNLIQVAIISTTVGKNPLENNGVPPTINKRVQNAVRACVLSHFGRVQLSATPWTMARQAPLSMGFSRQEYWRGLPFPSPGVKYEVSEVKLLSRVWLSVTPGTVAYQAPPSMWFSGQKYWSGLPFPSPQNAVLGCNLKDDKMILIHFQGKDFNITVIQVYDPTSNAKDAEVEWFYEDLHRTNTKKDVLFIAEDWNAKIGSQEISGVTGKFGLGKWSREKTNRVLSSEHTGHSKHSFQQ